MATDDGISGPEPHRQSSSDRRLPGWPPGRRRREGSSEQVPQLPTRATAEEGPAVDIAPHDPLLGYLQQHPEPVDLAELRLESPGVHALRQAGVTLIVPLVSQGELMGLLNLGARLSEQEYSPDDRRLLENLAGQAAPALRVAQLVREQEAEIRRRERYEREMQVAQLIQQNFLPREIPKPAGWHLAAFYRPAREVGGDFYDFIDLPSGELAVFVGDVTDKGVPAALVMASTRSILRASAQRLIEPGMVLERVNEQLCGDMPSNMFVTCLYGILRPETGHFRFANAGHNLPCVQTSDGACEPRATGMPLGLMPGMTYEENAFFIEPGRNAVLYSDALPEAHAPDGSMFGFPRMREVVGAALDHEEPIDRLLTELHRFTGPDWEQEDDITIVTLRRATTGPDPADDDGQGPLAEFEITSMLGNERAATRALAPIIATLGLSDRRRQALETAVAEATMNAIEHGNSADPSLVVKIRAVTDGGQLVVRIEDEGHGGAVDFSADEPDIEAKLRGDQSPRGWGLFLIRSMVDDVHVIPETDHHVIELVINLDETASAPTEQEPLS